MSLAIISFNLTISFCFPVVLRITLSLFDLFWIFRLFLPLLLAVSSNLTLVESAPLIMFQTAICEWILEKRPSLDQCRSFYKKSISLDLQYLFGIMKCPHLVVFFSALIKIYTMVLFQYKDRLASHWNKDKRSRPSHIYDGIHILVRRYLYIATTT